MGVSLLDWDMKTGLKQEREVTEIRDYLHMVLLAQESSSFPYMYFRTGEKAYILFKTCAHPYVLLFLKCLLL